MREWDKCYQFGVHGEQAVAKKLQRLGYAVVPLAQGEYKHAPSLYYMSDTARAVVLPDVSMWHPNRPPAFGEVKRKNQWVHFNGSNETGYDARLHEQYGEIQTRTRTELFLFFIHQGESPTGVYAQRYDKLCRVLRHWNGRTPAGRVVGKPEVLFPRTDLKFVWYLHELEFGTKPEHGPAQQELDLGNGRRR